ncbi:MAG: amino acid adenylation domain-containing protein [Pseudomonas sp.]|uniref:non-ribosomal peptide synthetase n=1 Tax=Pseudomonas sp. TaxID=306 RepID=UPI00339B055A
MNDLTQPDLNVPHACLTRTLGEPLRLSFAEQRLWFTQQLDPLSPAYNMPIASHVQGPLDVAALQAAYAELQADQAVLRSRYAANQFADGAPGRQVLAEDRLPFTLIDLSSQPERLEQQVQEAAMAPFDLTRTPPLRVTLLRLGAEQHVLVTVLHHIAGDGWSMGLLQQRVAQHYAAHLAGHPGPAAPRLAYADYADWQREQAQRGEQDAQLAYWCRQLQGLLPLDVPTDRPRGGGTHSRGAAVGGWLDSGLLARLDACARQHRVTRFMLLFAVYGALLARWSRCPDAAIAIPIANRRWQEFEDIIGFFVNTLIIRIDTDAALTFAQLLVQVRHTTLEAFAHQDLPFERLVETLNPERTPGRNPLSSVVFALQNAPMTGAQVAGLTLTPCPLEHVSTRADLELHLFEKTDGIEALLFYAEELFDRSSAERLWQAYVRLLDGVLTEPSRPLGQFDLNDATDNARLAAWENGPEADSLPLLQLFAEQVRSRPDSPAVSHGHQQLSFAELDRRARHLAAGLQAHGVAAGDRVALCLPHGLERVIAATGVWLAGAVFVSLEPNQPAERLRALLADAAPVLTLGECDGDAPGISVASLLARPGAPWHAAATAAPEALAYIIYTSGSTGQPKGVAIPHRGLGNLAAAQAELLGIGPGSRVLAWASPGFDASVFDLVMMWGCGATLVVASTSLLGPAALEAALDQGRVSHLTITPSALAVLDPANSRLDSLMVAGEACPEALATRWATRLRLYNGYGPTEASVWTSWERLDGASVTLGKPIRNVQIRLLDPAGQRVPLGALGELCIGGVGLASHYLNLPLATAAAFTGEAPQRLYRSGDLARWRSDGRLAFHGRADRQLKVRGVRIEPAEIEARMLQHPEVADAAVVLVADAAGGHLAAFVSARPQGGHAAGLENERVAQWRALYEATYAGATDPDPTLLLTGWASRLDGRPMPRDSMRRWAEATAQRIVELGGRRILEIGCGSGLIAFRLLAHCERYQGIDFSAAALHHIRQHLPAPLADRVSLTLGDALSVPLADGAWDTLVLNSVVQYFPGADYLLRVIERALRALAPGGHLFIGDLLNLDLEPVLATVAKATTAPRTSLLEARHYAAASAAGNEELLVAPAYFASLLGRLGMLESVFVLGKDGDPDNELTRFRYDVVLRKRGGPTPVERIEEIPTAERVQQRLQHSDARVLLLRDQPRTCLSGDLALYDGLLNGDPQATLGELLLPTSPARTLQQWHALAPGWRLYELWTGAAAAPDRCDLAFVRGPLPAGLGAAPRPAAEHYTNQPLREAKRLALAQLVLAQLRQQLPATLVPSSCTVLERLPVTASGKRDQAALERLASRAVVKQAPLPLGDSTAQRIGAIWRSALQLDSIGAEQNFFEIGGHSLLLVQVHARLEQVFDRRLPLLELFSHASIRALAAYLDGQTAAPEDDAQARAARQTAARARRRSPRENN